MSAVVKQKFVSHLACAEEQYLAELGRGSFIVKITADKFGGFVEDVYRKIVYAASCAAAYRLLAELTVKGTYRIEYTEYYTVFVKGIFTRELTSLHNVFTQVVLLRIVIQNVEVFAVHFESAGIIGSKILLDNHRTDSYVLFIVLA